MCPEPSSRSKHCSLQEIFIFIIEEGEAEEGEQGFWVVDDDTGEEGIYRSLHRERVLGSRR